MPSPDLIAVVTTIQAPTPSVAALVAKLTAIRASLLIVGDGKGPQAYDLPGSELLSLRAQLSLGFRLPGLLPVGHYSRKNVGYLVAIQRQPATIYETDDDNAPLAGFGRRCLTVSARRANPVPWSNVYRYFTEAPVWPRGFPLQRIHDCALATSPAETLSQVDAPIQQGLANGAPDVDAVWRLVLDRDITFRNDLSVVIPPGTWCPFNSQTTWWWPVAFPLLYLPSHCSFRMTDIWRSFVAQRCLWEIGAGVVFHAPEVTQQRNAHVLLRDFEDEIPGYLANERMVSVLGGLSLGSGPASIGSNLLRCYEALIGHGFLSSAEMPLVEAWLRDLESLPPLGSSR
jgi:STELLO glycosyltransferases